MAVVVVGVVQGVRAVALLPVKVALVFALLEVLRRVSARGWLPSRGLVVVVVGVVGGPTVGLLQPQEVVLE